MRKFVSAAPLRTLQLLFTIFSLCVLSACQHQAGNENAEKNLLSWTDTVRVNLEHPAVSIANNSTIAVQFRLDLNNGFPLSTEKMLLRINDISSKESMPKPKAAWKFISEHTYHLSTYAGQQWLYDPFKLMNSAGGGLCGDRAEVLARIWEQLGYESRVASLTGHVVPEAKVNDQWQLYDPDYEVYYVDSADNTVGIAQLENHACNGLRTIGKDRIKQLIVDCPTRDSENLMRKYASTENNTRSQPNPNVDLLKDENFILPSGSELIFINGDEKRPTMAVVRLTQKSSGTLRVPLIPYAWSGAGTFSLQKEKYEVKKEDRYRFSTSVFHDSITVIEVTDTVYVYYHVNPLLCRLSPTNVVRIKNATAKLDIASAANTPYIFDELRGVAMYFDDRKKEHLPFLNLLSIYNDSVMDKQMLRMLYHQFVTLDSTLDKNRQTASLLVFDTKFDMTRDTLHMDSETYMDVINRHFPRSVFFIFMTIRYSTYHYFQNHVLSDPDTPQAMERPYVK